MVTQDINSVKSIKTANVHVVNGTNDGTIFGVHHIIAFNEASTCVHEIDVDKIGAIIIYPQANPIEKAHAGTSVKKEIDFKKGLTNLVRKIFLGWGDNDEQ